MHIHAFHAYPCVIHTYLCIFMHICAYSYISMHIHPILSNPILSNPFQSCPILSYPIQSYPIQSNPIQSGATHCLFSTTVQGRFSPVPSCTGSHHPDFPEPAHRRLPSLGALGLCKDSSVQNGAPDDGQRPVTRHNPKNALGLPRIHI